MTTRVHALFLALFAATIAIGCASIDGPSDAQGSLTINIDSNCSGVVYTVDLYVDGTYIGTAAPGRGVSKNVAVGNHNLSGKSTTNSHVWGPFTYQVSHDGLTRTFTCF